ncbi:MAG: ABC transporter permease [Ancrocorticia sp.]|uniref:ABC transporter permease n=1 Tax=Ancrocorticia sp. TaxID=2593684 RepID=UPI003F92E338
MNTQHKMYLRMITRSFFGRLSRVLIASLSIAVGAATLSGLGLIAYTVPAQMQQELRSYGANLIVVPSGADSLTDESLAEADAVVGENLGRAPYQYTNLLYNQQPISAMGTQVDNAQKVRPYWEIDGSVPTREGEILVGEKVAEQYRFAVGDTVSLSEPTREDGAAENLTVSGLLHTGGPEDDLIVMGLDTLNDFTGGASEYNLIEYSVNVNGQELTDLAKETTDEDAGMEAEVVRRVSESESGIAQTLQTLIWIVSAIICVLTLIAISATLNAVVSERAREIGLKKALGAHAKDILREFIGESVLLGIIGGAVGSAIGIWMADFISMQAFSVRIEVSWWVVPVTLVLSVIIALVGSLGPAKRISKINPVDVLGGE